MWILVGEKFACIKISGRANLSSSLDFKSLVNELIDIGYRFFVLELSECLLMDSTFLGVLAGFGLRLGTGQNQPGEPAIELLNANARVTELLENLGVLHLFRLASGPLEVPANAEARSITPCAPSREELTRACLEAHQTLMQINPQNASRFKDVAQFMAEDLKRLKGSPK